jgi:DNA polymerase III subunit epsilon
MTPTQTPARPVTTKWNTSRMAAFDLDTTGVDPESDRIVTAAVVFVNGGKDTEYHDWLVNPGVPIPAAATNHHRITTEDATGNGVAPSDAIEEIVALLTDAQKRDVPIVAFNARYDLTMLDREARRHGVVPLVDRLGGVEQLLVIDPFVIDRAIDQYRRGSRTLSTTAVHYGAGLDQFPNSTDHAVTTARLAYQIGKHPEMAEVTLRKLHDWQVAWATAQADDLAEHFRSRNIDRDVPRDWPIVPLHTS